MRVWPIGAEAQAELVLGLAAVVATCTGTGKHGTIPSTGCFLDSKFEQCSLATGRTCTELLGTASIPLFRLRIRGQAEISLPDSALCPAAVLRGSSTGA